MELEQIIEMAKQSPALKMRSNEPEPFSYPNKWNDRVPLKVKMKETVTSDMVMFFPHDSEMIAIGGNEYYCWVNSYGALSAILPHGERLGLKPDEFEVIEFHPETTIN